MVTLQHLAVNALVQSGCKYDGSDVIVEDVVFEVDQLRTGIHLEIGKLKDEYKLLQITKTEQSYSGTTKIFDRLKADISVELFDEFTYSYTTTLDEVKWKEYFHCIYDQVVPEDMIPYNNRIWEILPPPPEDLDANSHGWRLINSIKTKFAQLRAEGDKATPLNEILQEQFELGKEMIKLKKKILHKGDILNIYNGIIEWSMH